MTFDEIDSALTGKGILRLIRMDETMVCVMGLVADAGSLNEADIALIQQALKASEEEKRPVYIVVMNGM